MPDVAELEGAFADRLDLVTGLLGGGGSGERSGDGLGAASVRFEAALGAADLPDATLAWLVWVAVRATFPLQAEAEAVRRRMLLGGRGALAEWAWHEFPRTVRDGTANRRRLRLPGAAVVVDVTHTASVGFHTGIQRVVRETAPRWCASEGASLFGWDLTTRFPTPFSAADHVRFGRWRERGAPPIDVGGRAATASVDVLLPWQRTVVVPELAADPVRSDCYRTMARAGICRRLSLIAYDLIPVTIGETVAEGMGAAFAGFLSMARHAQRISAISASTADGYAAFAGMVGAQGLPGPAVAAHPLPTERPFLGRTALGRARRRLARARGAAEGPIVAVVGSHEPRKNHVRVLVAAEQLWREGRRFRLLFIGAAGWRGERFARLVEELVAAGRPIEVVTRADETTLWAAYRLARFSVFPSLNEGFGLPVVESLVSGTPVITSNVGSLAEIASGGGALVVDPRGIGDLRRAMATLLDDDDLLDDLRAQARRRRWKTWDEYATETWQHLAG